MKMKGLTRKGVTRVENRGFFVFEETSGKMQVEHG